MMCCLLGFLARDAAAGARPARPAAVPVIQVAQRELDSRPVEPGEPVRFAFRVKNAGGAPLQIRGVESNCGCVVAEFDRRLAPGAQGWIRVTVDTFKAYGMTVRNLAVESNDPAHPTLMLVARTRIRHALEVLPGDNLVVPVTPGRSIMRELILRCHERQPLEVTRIDVAAPYVTVEPIARPTEEEIRVPGATERCYRITIAPTAPAEGFETSISFQTNSVRRPQLDVRILGRAQGAILVSPPRLYFGQVRSVAEPTARRMLTLTRAETIFRILVIRSTDARIQTEIGTTNGGFWPIAVTYTGGWPPGKVTGSLIIETDDPAYPRIEVPFQADVSQ